MLCLGLPRLVRKGSEPPAWAKIRKKNIKSKIRRGGYLCFKNKTRDSPDMFTCVILSPAFTNSWLTLPLLVDFNLATCCVPPSSCLGSKALQKIERQQIQLIKKIIILIFLYFIIIRTTRKINNTYPIKNSNLFFTINKESKIILLA